ncbi:MAG: DNA repair protein RecN [Clostridia bacterium]|nr:DNA repair protein RecN [Clostridia bacterium]
MLQSLHIENVAVIRRADIDFSEGLCVLTGETGAGKSLLIDSINALTGGRVNRELIRTGEDKAMISALFSGLDESTMRALEDMGLDLPPCDDALMLQRVFTRDGRSTARINGRAVTQSLLRDAGALLINIHGQSDNQKLMQKSSHLSLLDDYARDGETLSLYRDVYGRWRSVSDKLESLRQDESERLRTREMLEFQIKDIESARLKPGEEEKLTERRDRLLYQEKISKQVRIASRAMKDSEKSTVLSLLDRAEAALTAIASLIPEADGLVARLQEVRYEAEDIADEIGALCDEDVQDPTAELDKLEGRLDTINRLGRKYGAGIDAILAFRDTSAARLAELDGADESIAEYEEQQAVLAEELHRLSMTLSEQRRAAAHELAAMTAESLAFLDMPKVRFEVSVRPLGHFGPDGADDVEFLIATNPGEPVQPMIRIASGGELSRIMLAVRSVLNERYGVGTAIYDEVDTGISGRTARKVGIKLCAIAGTSQVICVTHSAQIASLADAHYVIEKSEADGRAETAVRLLSGEEQVDEVARILGGLTLTDSQRANARELIAEKQTIRQTGGR